METREELLNEHTKWTVKYVDADKHLKELLPPVTNVSGSKETQPYILNEEKLADLDSAEKDVETALNRLQEIREKLSQLR